MFKEQLAKEVVTSRTFAIISHPQYLHLSISGFLLIIIFLHKIYAIEILNHYK